jgi:hypothetical protein
MEKNGKPVFEMIVDYDDQTGMIRNSFVENPAVEYERYAFSKVDNFKFKQDDSEQKFISVSILADTPILRRNDEGEEFYVVFSKETIKKIVNKFVMENLINQVSFQHNDNEIIDGVYLVEHFIIDKGRVESPLFKDAPQGSWITTYWVKDKEQYEALKANPQFKGFSIEINAKIQEAFSAIVNEEKILNDIKDIAFNEMLSDSEKEAEIKKVLNNI